MTLQAGVIIPALDEEESLPLVLRAIPRCPLPGVEVVEVVVVDNGSTDGTAAAARERGATVVREERRGYGAACLRGLAALHDGIEAVVFLDADFSDHPEEMGLLLEPILKGEADLVIGSRTLGAREPGALPPQARLGNRLAVSLIRLIWGVRYTDLGPFRAIRRDALPKLRMTDRDYGWTIEMQIRAAEEGLRIAERPVSYRRRVGKSKISGTVSGAARAGAKILLTIVRFSLRRLRA